MIECLKGGNEFRKSGCCPNKCCYKYTFLGSQKDWTHTDAKSKKTLPLSKKISDIKNFGKKEDFKLFFLLPFFFFTPPGSKRAV